MTKNENQKTPVKFGAIEYAFLGTGFVVFCMFVYSTFRLNGIPGL